MKRYIVSFLMVGYLYPCNTFEMIAEKVAQSVVEVYAYRDNNIFHPVANDPIFNEFFGNRRSVSSGSGAIISADGLIATCAHVVGDADKISIVLYDGQKYPVQVVYKDRGLDVAFLKINKKISKLTFININEDKKLKLGQAILMAGNAFGIGKVSVGHGIVSMTERFINGKLLLQTDAPMNPGNSGGPLVNADGELEGIAHAIFSRSGASNGVGFGIVKKTLLYCLRKMQGEADAWWGINIQELTPELSESISNADAQLVQGVIVTEIAAASPLKSTLKTGDIISAVNNSKITSSEELYYYERIAVVGKSVNLSIWRQGQLQEITFKPSNFPDNLNATNKLFTIQAKGTPFNGVKVQSLKSRSAAKIGLTDVKGLIIMDAPEDSGLEEGDIIININGIAINNPGDLNRALEIRQKGFSYIINRKGALLQQVIVRG